MGDYLVFGNLLKWDHVKTKRNERKTLEFNTITTCFLVLIPSTVPRKRIGLILLKWKFVTGIVCFSRWADTLCMRLLYSSVLKRDCPSSPWELENLFFFLFFTKIKKKAVFLRRVSWHLEDSRTGTLKAQHYAWSYKLLSGTRPFIVIFLRYHR